MTLKRLLHKIKMGPKWFWGKVWYFLKWKIMQIQKICILNPLSLKIRPWLWKLSGVNIKGSVKIGYDVYYDVGYAHLITIEEGTWITSRCLLLCHRRDMSDYKKGDNVNMLPYITSEIKICKGVHLGMGSIVMPGITIGEGAIIGAGSIITKDIPPWTIAVGSPAKVVKVIEERG